MVKIKTLKFKMGKYAGKSNEDKGIVSFDKDGFNLGFSPPSSDLKTEKRKKTSNH